MKTTSYISKNPEIMGGMPVITGTRIPVARIIHLLKEGYTLDNIADQYSWVKKNTILGAIDELIENLQHDKKALKIS